MLRSSKINEHGKNSSKLILRFNVFPEMKIKKFRVYYFKQYARNVTTTQDEEKCNMGSVDNDNSIKLYVSDDFVL
jgi:ADP-glucose pyrophosphorylase